MGKEQNYQYFVEGEDERKIVNVLKTDLKYIKAGNVQVLNAAQERITKLRMRNLKQGTKVVLIFDTDTGDTPILHENIDFLKNQSVVSEVICITQVKNLEDELIRSCNIKQVKELVGSKSNSDFKHDLIKEKNLASKLKRAEFDFNSFWVKEDTGTGIANDAEKIKLKKAVRK